MPTLYTLADRWAALQSRLEEADGEITPSLETEIDSLDTALPSKVDGVAKLIETFELRAEARRKAAARIIDLARRDENAVARLKAYLLRCLNVAGLRRIESELHMVTVCKNSQPSIKWTRDTSEIPSTLRHVETVVTVDTAACREWLKEFGTLPEGFEFAHGEHVRIK